MGYLEEQGISKGAVLRAGLGLGLLLGCLMTFVISDGLLALSAGRSLYRTFMVVSFLSAGACCVAAFVHQAVWHRPAADARDDKAEGEPRVPRVAWGKVCVWVATALLSAGLLLYVSLSQDAPAASSWVSCAPAVALGLSAAYLFMCWCQVYCGFSFKPLVVASACAMGVAVLFLAVSLFLPGAWFAAALDMAGAVLSAGLVRSFGRMDGAGAVRGLSRGARPDSGSTCFREVAIELWRPLALAVIVSWAFGLVWDVALDQLAAYDVTPYDWSLLVGQLVAAAVCLLLVKVDVGAFSSVVYTVVLPLVAATLLLLPTLAGEIFIPVSFELNLLSWACTSVIYLMLWVQLAHSAQLSGVSGVFLLAAAGALCLATVAAGLLLRQYLGKTGQVVTLVLLIAYFVANVYLSGRAGQTAEPRCAEAAPTLDRVALRCEQLSTAHGLSPRESEVVVLLGRGYSQSYIASELQVSESTVHTHARKIYGKLGVSSRSELVALINSEEGNSLSR